MKKRTHEESVHRSELGRLYVDEQVYIKALEEFHPNKLNEF